MDLSAGLLGATAPTGTPATDFVGRFAKRNKRKMHAPLHQGGKRNPLIANRNQSLPGEELGGG
jgi:hypothetical protein